VGWKAFDLFAILTITPKILVFSVHDERIYVDGTMNARVKGYVTKYAHPEILVAAI
jgi:two-component system invasion response regulator UvrY